LNKEVRQQNADDCAAKGKNTVEALIYKKLSLKGAAAELEKMGVKTARGGTEWTAAAVRNVIKRAA
jgi:hypothetical protein